MKGLKKSQWENQSQDEKVEGKEENKVAEEEKDSPLQNSPDIQKRKYLGYANKLKLEFLELFLDYRKKEAEKESPQSENELIRKIIKELNQNINFNSAKNWTTLMKNKPEYRTSLSSKTKF